MNNVLKNVCERIYTSTPNVDIIAVTKTHPYSVVCDAYAVGFRHIGENRVEEAKLKIDSAHQDRLRDICWHMVGHVQSRVVRDVVSLFDRVDSVDSIELLRKFDTEVQRQHKTLRVLLEINVSGEASKFGFQSIDALTLRHIDTKHVRIDGLMTMAPYVSNPEDNRWIFRNMKKLSQHLQKEINGFGNALSMGTSCDYTVAIEEGATEVRLGKALFGPRK